MGLTNFLTDIPGRYIEVFDDQIVASWHDMAMKKKLISEKTWNWCLAELLDKARLFETTNSVMVLDAGARICKSDTIVRPELHAQLKEAIEILTTLFYEQNWPSHCSDEQVVNIIDPSLYSLVCGKTKVLSEGRKVGLQDFADSYGQGIIAEPPEIQLPRARAELIANIMERSGLPFFHDSELYHWSTKYQWLPGEVTFNNTSPTSVNITSYINNLHLTTQNPLYNLIEKFISLSIEPWNSVIMKGEHGRAPIRIRTYDTVDEAEVHAIAAAERAEYKDRSEPFDSPTLFPPCNHNPQHPGPGTAFT